MTPVKEKAPTAGVKTSRRLEDEEILRNMKVVREPPKTKSRPSVAPLLAAGGIAGAAIAWLFSSTQEEPVHLGHVSYSFDIEAEAKYIADAYQKIILPGWKDHISLEWFQKHFYDCWKNEIKRRTEKHESLTWDEFHDFLAWLATEQNDEISGIYMNLAQQKHLTPGWVGDWFSDLVFRLDHDKAGQYEIISHIDNVDRDWTTIKHLPTGNFLKITYDRDQRIKIHFSPCVEGEYDSRDLEECALTLDQNVYDLYEMIQSKWTNLVDNTEVYPEVEFGNILKKPLINYEHPRVRGQTLIEKMEVHRLFAGPWKFNKSHVNYYLESWYRLLTNDQSGDNDKLDRFMRQARADSNLKPTPKTWAEFYQWADNWALNTRLEQPIPELPGVPKSTPYYGTVKDLVHRDVYINMYFEEHKEKFPDTDKSEYCDRAREDFRQHLSDAKFPNDQPTWGHLYDFIHIWANRWYRKAPVLLPYVEYIQKNHHEMIPDLKMIAEDVFTIGPTQHKAPALEYKGLRVFIHEKNNEHTTYRLINAAGEHLHSWVWTQNDHALVAAILLRTEPNCFNANHLTDEKDKLKTTAEPGITLAGEVRQTDLVKEYPEPMKMMMQFLSSSNIKDFIAPSFHHNWNINDPSKYEIIFQNTGRKAIFELVATDRVSPLEWVYSIYDKSGFLILCGEEWSGPDKCYNYLAGYLPSTPPDVGQVLGRVDPLRSFQSYDGTSVRLMVEGKPVGNVTEVTFSYDPATEAYKTELKFMLLDKGIKDITAMLNGKDIELLGANEYGNRLSIVKGKIQVEQVAGRITPDDLLLEITMTCTISENGTRTEPTKKLQLDHPGFSPFSGTDIRVKANENASIPPTPVAYPNPILRLKDFIENERPNDLDDFEFTVEANSTIDACSVLHKPTGNKAELECLHIANGNRAWFFRLLTPDVNGNLFRIYYSGLASSEELYRFIVRGTKELDRINNLDGN